MIGFLKHCGFMLLVALLAICISAAIAGFVILIIKILPPVVSILLFVVIVFLVICAATYDAGN